MGSTEFDGKTFFELKIKCVEHLRGYSSIGRSSIPGLFSLQRMPPPLLFQAIVRVRVRAIVLLFLGLGLGLGLGGKVRVKMLISPCPLGLGLGLRLGLKC